MNTKSVSDFVNCENTVLKLDYQETVHKRCESLLTPILA